MRRDRRCVIQDARPFWGSNVETDHFMVLVKCVCIHPVASRRTPQRRTTNAARSGTYKTWLLQEQSIDHLYKSRMSRHIAEDFQKSVNDQCETVCEAVKTVSGEVLEIKLGNKPRN